jgi:hypothetical protein
VDRADVARSRRDEHLETMTSDAMLIVAAVLLERSREPARHASMSDAGSPIVAGEVLTGLDRSLATTTTMTP